MKRNIKIHCSSALCNLKVVIFLIGDTVFLINFSMGILRRKKNVVKYINSS
jgi:hypothetical protein